MAALGGQRDGRQPQASYSRSRPAALPPQLLAGPRFAPKSLRAGWPARVTWQSRVHEARSRPSARVPGRPGFLAVGNASPGGSCAVRRLAFGGAPGSEAWGRWRSRGALRFGERTEQLGSRSGVVHRAAGVAWGKLWGRGRWDSEVPGAARVRGAAGRRAGTPRGRTGTPKGAQRSKP